MFEQELEALLKEMKARGVLKTRKVEEAFRAAPRHLFVPEAEQRSAYRDIPLPIGQYQTISQPSTVVAMTEALDVQPGQKILEIGAGSGWQAALLAHLTGPKGIVFSMERLIKIADLAKFDLERAKITNAHVILGDGSLGLAKQAPYDRIMVTCACPDIPPPLREQLKVGGKMVIPIGDAYTQDVQIITKTSEHSIDRRSIGMFRFVPLIGLYGFKK